MWSAQLPSPWWGGDQASVSSGSAPRDSGMVLWVGEEEACGGIYILNWSRPSISHLLNLFAVAAKTKSQDLGGWSNRNIFSSQSQRLEVQDQGICKAGSFFFQLTFLTSWASQVVHKRLEFDPRIRKIPWRKKWQPTTVFLCGESHGERSLVGS